MYQEIFVKKVTDLYFALREVDLDSSEYKSLRQSIKDRGMLVPIIVVPSPEGYTAIEGLARLTAARDLGLETIPAMVHSLNTAEILEIQLIVNQQRSSPKNANVARQLARLMAYEPSLVLSELSKRLTLEPSKILRMLRLNLLTSVLRLVLEDKILVANAYAIGQLPPDEQIKLRDEAQTLRPVEFAAMCKRREKELRDLRRAL